MLLLAEDEDEGGEGEVNDDQEEKLMELSACSAEGLTSPRTLIEGEDRRKGGGGSDL